MTTYDSMTIAPQIGHSELELPTSTTMDISNSFLQNLNYSGDSTFDVNSDLSSIGFTPFDFDTYGASFPDPTFPPDFFESLGDGSLNNSDLLSPNLDNKLLGFGAPIHKAPVLDASGQTWPRMSAELNGMFCVAEDVFEGDAMGRPLELTCYRRNLFQISGNITLSRSISHAIVDQANQSPIFDLMATLSATESIEGKSTEIITVPWKSGGPNGTTSEEKGGAAPMNIMLDLTSNQEADPAFVTIPIAWGRLQFKNATANNGKRKGLQQHYQVQISLMARSQADGQLIKLAEIQSNAIVVRGRSPKNFDSSKDVPLSDRAHFTERKDSRPKSAAAQNITSQWIEPALSQGQGYYSQSPFQSLDTTWPGATPVPDHRSKKPALSPTTSRKSRPSTSDQIKPDPIKLSPPSSLIFDKPSTSLSLDDDAISDAPPDSVKSSDKPANLTSPQEPDDQLYEYFPLSLDDWMPPVDAIYRPHVVHHLRVQVDGKAQQARQRPKRYFSGED